MVCREKRFWFCYPMKNNKMDAMIRRDENVRQGLETDKALYAPLEEDIAPLREALSVGLDDALELADEVFVADGDDSATVKRGTRGKLRTLAGRVGKALVAHADSPTNTDEDLKEHVKKAIRELPNADSATFAQAAEKLLTEATPLAPKLVKREITADDLAEGARLLTKFKKRLATGRAADVQGKNRPRAAGGAPCKPMPSSSSASVRNWRPTKAPRARGRWPISRATRS